MTRQFISEALETDDAGGAISGEPQLPVSFEWRDERLVVANLLRTWRTTKEDRGDVYLKRHWFEFDADDGRRVVVYFDRGAKRGQPHWWLYTIEDA